jgi:hypothetical protein
MFVRRDVAPEEDDEESTKDEERTEEEDEEEDRSGVASCKITCSVGRSLDTL